MYVRINGPQRFGENSKALQTRKVEREDVERIWSSIHTFLVAAGNISKILWPPKKEYSDRGDALRKDLSVENGSPLGIRTPRNYLEHFDVYLQEWIGSAENHRYIDNSFGSLKLIKVDDPGFEKGDFFRFFDYQLWVIFLVSFRLTLNLSYWACVIFSLLEDSR